MRYSTRASLIVALLVVATVSVAGAAGVVAAETTTDDWNTSDDRGHPYIEDGLLSDGDAGTNGSTQTGSETVRVIVEAREGQADAAARAVEERGSLEARHGGLLRASVPRRSLEALADESAVRFIRQPILTQQQGDYTSEGVETVGADLAQDRGWGGNATVVVIDHGFDPTHEPIADNVVHTNDTTGEGIGGYTPSDTNHGDASAAIVTDVAPDVDLVLVAAQGYFEILKAIFYVNNNEWGENGSHLEIDAVSMSLGFGGGLPNDGTSTVDQEIDNSVTGGTPWFVSSGNQAGGKHWNGTFQDTDDDGFHEFADGDSCNDLTGPLEVRLQWNDWPGSDQDYDIHLYEYTSDGNLSTDPVASSTTTQSGDQPPREILTWNSDGDYCLTIEKVNADGTADFDLFYQARATAELEYFTNTRSVAVPATANEVTSVGAVKYSNRKLRFYSSRGPTIDGRTKPELVGPDGVSTAAYGTEGYLGTSAATPHAAGVAALVRGANESVGANGTNARLKATADSLGKKTPNNRIGAGLTDAAAAAPPQNPTATDPPSGIDDDNESSVPVTVTFQHPPKNGSVRVVLEDEAGTTVGNSTALDTGNNSTTVTVDASALDDGNVTVRASTTDSFGWSNPTGLTGETTVRKDTTATVADYANSENVVDTDGLRSGIDDWRSGNIDTTLLREIIDYWRSGDPVE